VSGGIFGDEAWTDADWKKLLDRLVSAEVVSWKDVATLTLGHMNPSQVGTSLASSAGFKRTYGKGKVMPLVMKWFYAQDGRCADCDTRLELQADHVKSRQEFAQEGKDPLDADFIENMTLRCRRHNVIRRGSHLLGGKTHLTAEAALMWILFNFKPRTLTDFVRMCRLYGMTMADVRMQEGWAMAHWLNKLGDAQYALDREDRPANLLLWPDGGVTRMWDGDAVPKLDEAHVIARGVTPGQHLAILCAIGNGGAATQRVQLLRYSVGMLPFSHYFPDRDGEVLAIQYTPPDRTREPELGEGLERETATKEGADLEEMAEVSEETQETLPATQRDANIRPLLPRGSRVLRHALLDAGQTVRVGWTQGRKSKNFDMPPTGRTKKLCDLTVAELEAAGFSLNPV
jgi:hypothetical protein